MIKKLLILSTLALSLPSCLNVNKSGSGDVVPELTPSSAIGSRTKDGEEVKLNGATAKQITLSNNLKVTLISAPTSSKSAMSVGVNVGHMDNPVEHQGLAHYLEHMLFLGTKNFPDVDGYNQFLNANGGGSNAYTSTNHTNYYFDVNNSAFEEAVHRMSRFFVNPLFDETYSEREKNAVQNEFKIRYARFASGRVYKAFYREDSRSRLFSIGNYASLGDTKVEDTKKFYKEHYYTEAMHAVLAGPQNLDDLEKLAAKYLSDIVSKPDQELNVHEESLLIDQSKLPATVLSRPFEGNEDSIGILIPFNNDHENKTVLKAISALVGEKGLTSLMKFFVDKGWITAKSENYYASAFKEGISFGLNNLTEEGIKNKQEILNYFYTFIKFLSESSTPSYLSDEILSINEASGRKSSYYEISGALVESVNSSYFREEPGPSNLPELFFGKEPSSFTEDDYKAVLADLNWSKPLIFDESPSNPVLETNFTQIEKPEIGGFSIVTNEDGVRVIEDSVYDFAFELTGVKEFELKEGAVFNLKPENPYAPKDFEVYNQAGLGEKYQKVSGEWGEIYWSDLGETGVAFTQLSLDMFSHGINFDSKVDVTSLFLMRELLKEQILFGAYPLKQMGYSFSFPIGILQGAMTLEFNGWSDGYLQALEDFMKLSNLNPDQDTFDSIKKNYVSRILIDKEGDIDNYMSREGLSRVTKAYLNFDEILSGLDELDYDTYIDFTKRFAKGLYFRGALSGDVLESYPEKIISTITETWGVEDSGLELDFTTAHLASNNILNSENLAVNAEGPSPVTSVYRVYRNLGLVENDKEKLMMKVLTNWLGPDYFTELRTNQGLAYSLYAYFPEFVDHHFLVTSLTSEQPASFTSEKVEEFISKWANEVLPTKNQANLDGALATLVQRDSFFPVDPSGAHSMYKNLVSLGMSSLEEYNERLALYDEITLEEVVSLGQSKLIQTPTSGVFLRIEKKPDAPISTDELKQNQ